MHTQGTTMEGKGSLERGVRAGRRRLEKVATLHRESTRLERQVRALGWLGIGLGVLQLAVPQRLARLLGTRDDALTKVMLFSVGLREIGNGLGLLVRPGAKAWAWARVAGGVVDLALLGAVLGSKRSDRLLSASAGAARAGLMLIDLATAAELGKRPVQAPRSVQVSTRITVHRAPDEVYGFWRHFQNLPRFMAHLESVEVLNGRSRWRARVPGGLRVEWEAEIVGDVPNESIAWRSLPGSNLPNHGSVRFLSAPGGRGTEVHVELEYRPRGGPLGTALGKLLRGINERQLENDLRRFKQVMEVGEVVQSDSSIHRGPHPARPAGPHDVTR